MFSTKPPQIYATRSLSVFNPHLSNKRLLIFEIFIPLIITLSVKTAKISKTMATHFECSYRGGTILLIKYQ